VLDGQHWTAAAATVSASAYRRLSSKKAASAWRGAGRCGSAAIAARSRFSASTLCVGALTLSETDWVSRCRNFSCRQAARASRGAATCGDSAIDFRNRSSSSIHWPGNALAPAARRSSSSKEASACRGAANCGAKAMAFRSTSSASTRWPRAQIAAAISDICLAVRSAWAICPTPEVLTLATAS
jgi:hypothetical protein